MSLPGPMQKPSGLQRRVPPFGCFSQTPAETKGRVLFSCRGVFSTTRTRSRLFTQNQCQAKPTGLVIQNRNGRLFSVADLVAGAWLQCHDGGLTAFSNAISFGFEVDH